jgi:hypothetical protein
MLRLAQHGTRTLLLVCALASCTDARRAPGTGTGTDSTHAGSGAVPIRDSGIAGNDAGFATGGRPGSTSGAAGSGAAGGGAVCAPLPCPSGAPWNAATCSCSGPSNVYECTADSDCTLVAKGCCSICPPATRDYVVPTTRARADEVQSQQCPSQVSCGACQILVPDPVAPVLHAGCVEHRCVVVDLRSADFSKCTRDSDCEAVALGCCGANSDAPTEYAGIRDDSDAGILECVPAPPCGPPSMHGEPLSFCASDGHCAVRRREHAGGTESMTCYSPSQNVDHAYDDAAVGCDCGPRTASVCRADSTGRLVALICQESGHWQSANDGPCWSKP